MTKKLEISRDLVERAVKAIEKHHSSMAWEIAKDLRALLSEPKMCDCNQGRLPCTCKLASPLIQTLHANGDLLAMEATIAQQAQRIADLERGRGEPVAWVDAEIDSDKGKVIDWHIGSLDELPHGAKLYAEQPAPVAVAPKGWKLVPIEPTAEMIEALAADIYPDDNQAGKRLQRLRGTNIVFPKYEIESAVGKYERMITAAPDCLDLVKELNQ